MTTFFTFLTVLPRGGAPFVGAFFLAFALVILAIFLIPAIFYLITLQNTLKAIQPQNRKMEPGQVWLLLIPVFSLIWHFIVVARISDSIQAELTARGESTTERPAYGIGLALCILCLTAWIPFIGNFSFIAIVVCWIIYWVKVNEYRRKFLQPYIQQDSQIFNY